MSALLGALLKGQYRHDQQGVESECLFLINSVTENNTPHEGHITCTIAAA